MIHRDTTAVNNSTHQKNTSENSYVAVIAISTAAALGGFLFGFDSSVINGAIEGVAHRFNTNDWQTGILVSMALLGSAIGAWFAGGFSDRYGRKPVMTFGGILFLLASLGSSLSTTVYLIGASRFIGGIGIGVVSVIPPTYIAEIAPAKFRGSLAAMQQLAITLGIFIALLSDAIWQGFAHGTSNNINFLGITLPAWRWMFLIEIIPATVYAFISLTIPESPRFLVEHNQKFKAKRILSRISHVADPDKKVEEISASISRTHKSSLADLRGNTFGLKRVVWIGIILACLQQLVGINTIFYYSTTLWKSVGFNDNSAFTISVITSIINVAMTFVAIIFVDRLGRKIILKAGSIFMAIGLAITAIAFSQQIGAGKSVSLPSPWGQFALIGANLFIIAFAASWGPIIFILLGELFNNKIRSIAMSVSLAANWITNFFISLSFPFLSNKIGLTWIYGAFAVFSVASFIFVKKYIPETKGLELENVGGD